MLSSTESSMMPCQHDATARNYEVRGLWGNYSSYPCCSLTAALSCSLAAATSPLCSQAIRALVSFAKIVSSRRASIYSCSHNACTPPRSFPKASTTACKSFREGPLSLNRDATDWSYSLDLMRMNSDTSFAAQSSCFRVRAEFRVLLPCPRKASDARYKAGYCFAHF